MDKKYVVLTSFFNDCNWYGNFNSKILIRLEYRKTKEPTGLLSDTLWFESKAFCDIDPNTKKLTIKEKFADTQMLNTSGNAGSFTKFVNYSPQILKKVRKALKEAGYIIIDKVNETLPVELVKLKNHIPNKYDLLMTSLFKNN